MFSLAFILSKSLSDTVNEYSWLFISSLSSVNFKSKAVKLFSWTEIFFKFLCDPKAMYFILLESQLSSSKSSFCVRSRYFKLFPLRSKFVNFVLFVKSIFLSLPVKRFRSFKFVFFDKSIVSKILLATHNFSKFLHPLTSRSANFSTLANLILFKFLHSDKLRLAIWA